MSNGCFARLASSSLVSLPPAARTRFCAAKWMRSGPAGSASPGAGSAPRAAARPRPRPSRESFCSSVKSTLIRLSRFRSRLVAYVDSPGKPVGRDPVSSGDEYSASDGVAERDPEEVPGAAGEGDRFGVIAREREAEHGHVGDAVFESAGDEREQAPPDDDALRGIGIDAGGHPQSEAHEPVA